MLTVRAAPGSVAEAIGQSLAKGLSPSQPVALVDAMPPTRAAPLDDLNDADLESGLIQPLADLTVTLAQLLPGHKRIVLIGTTAGLGQWDAVLAAGYASGVVGLMRSAALEFMGDGISINMVALASADAAMVEPAAILAAALLQSGGVNGQIIACDGGSNLRMSQARPRR